MLDAFAAILVQNDNKATLEDELTEQFKKLGSVEEITKVASEIATIKNAYCGPEDYKWLKQYEGTPLYEKAMQLEEEQLNVEAARIKSRMEKKEDDFWAQEDMIRLKKKMLDLDLAKSNLGKPDDDDDDEHEETPEPEMTPKAAGLFYSKEDWERERERSRERSERRKAEEEQRKAEEKQRKAEEKQKWMDASPLPAYGLSALKGVTAGAPGGALGGYLLGGGKGALIGGGVGAGLGAATNALTLALERSAHQKKTQREAASADNSAPPKTASVDYVDLAGRSLAHALYKHAADAADLQKTAADLTPAQRDKVKSKNFAVHPKGEEPKYPIPDAAHARNALVRVRQFGSPSEKASVYKAVTKKYPALATRSDVIPEKTQRKAEKRLGLGKGQESQKEEKPVQKLAWFGSSLGSAMRRGASRVTSGAHLPGGGGGGGGAKLLGGFMHEGQAVPGVPEHILRATGHLGRDAAQVAQHAPVGAGELEAAGKAMRGGTLRGALEGMAGKVRGMFGGGAPAPSFERAVTAAARFNELTVPVKYASAVRVGIRPFDVELDKEAFLAAAGRFVASKVLPNVAGPAVSNVLGKATKFADITQIPRTLIGKGVQAAGSTIGGGVGKAIGGVGKFIEPS